jgi:tetratricopeptide (TPR) repeat protein
MKTTTMRVVGAVLMGAAFAMGANAAGSAAQVFSLEGKGEFREARENTWRPVKVTHDLFPTNFVRTLDMSRMAILFSDRTQVRLSQNSVLQIKEVAGATDASTTINLNKGRSWVQSKTTPNGLKMETPSAVAAIRGTDWEMAVDDEGRATLSVFSGEVSFFNEQGSVLVAANEQARAEKGKAPVKLLLRTSRERIQWVSSFTIDPDRYAELRGTPRTQADVVALVREQRLGEAYEALKRSTGEGANAVSYLLLSDFEIYRGELPAAADALSKGAARFPSDERFDIALARLALLEDRPQDAVARANAALAKKRDSVDALVALGDIERHEGRGAQATAAYARAAAIAAKDSRPWYGLGAVEGERENVRRARSHLEKAIALDPEDASYRAELGTVEGFAGRLDVGREYLRKALELQPDNYVAWTGLGVVELKAGNDQAALEALLRASLIEPKYARAHLYLAATYYQMERDSAAFEELKRASQADPNDPLPHLLASIIRLDRFEAGLASEEAQEALKLLPFLKSLNQVADNQKGVANTGYPLAFMGLETWARSSAQDSYLPFWGGSHLFLSDRYVGDFARRSEQMQGYITDPLVFGASNRFQTLFLDPGHHGTASMRYNQTDDVKLYEPVLTLNGYVAGAVPFSYFGEVVDDQIEPRNTDLTLRSKTYTAALGAKPTHEVGVFGFATYTDFTADIGQPGVTGDFARLTGHGSRVDGGVRYAPDAQSSVWIKAGAFNENARFDEVVSVVVPGVTVLKATNFGFEQKSEDAAVRYVRAMNDALELSAGIEASRTRQPLSTTLDTVFRQPTDIGIPRTLDEPNDDRYKSVNALARFTRGALRIEAGAIWRDYRKDRSFVFSGPEFTNGPVTFDEHHHHRNTDPLVGAVLRLNEDAKVRAACRRWLRPIGPDTLMPVAIAGIPVEDLLVLPGGEQKHCKVQAEWTLSKRSFVSASAEEIRTHNLISLADGVLNQGVTSVNLERLRNRVLTPPGKPDYLEDVPVFGEGRVSRATLAYERILTPRIGARFYYVYTHSENTGNGFDDLPLPYLARHQANAGLTWSLGPLWRGWRCQLTALATYRTRRFTDEPNTILLPAGWDNSVTLFLESPDKRWAIEAYGANLAKKETSDVFGMVVSYRF